MVFTLATTPADHSVWWWILGIVAVIGMIWWWSAAAGSRVEVGKPRSDPRPPAHAKRNAEPDGRSGSDRPGGDS